jgi:hypothetical protein
VDLDDAEFLDLLQRFIASRVANSFNLSPTKPISCLYSAGRPASSIEAFFSDRKPRKVKNTWTYVSKVAPAEASKADKSPSRVLHSKIMAFLFLARFSMSQIHHMLINDC